MWYQSKNLWVGVFAFAVVALLLYAIYLWGKRSGSESNVPSIPGDSLSNPLTDDEKRTIGDLTTRLKKDIEGWFDALWRDTEAYYDLEKSSDRVFVGVSNLYKKQTGRNLFADIPNELSFNPFLVDATKRIVNRAKNLKLY